MLVGRVRRGPNKLLALRVAPRAEEAVEVASLSRQVAVHTGYAVLARAGCDLTVAAAGPLWALRDVRPARALVRYILIQETDDDQADPHCTQDVI